MRIRTSCMLLLAGGVLGLTGCPTPDPTCGCGPGMTPCPGVICIADDAGADTGLPTDTGPLGDVPRVDAPLATGCGTVGAVGGHCRGGSGGTCASGFDCQNEIRSMMTGMTFTIRTGFGIEQGRNPDADGFYEEVPEAEAVPANDIPIPMATGSLCTQECDAGAMTDTCGTCATCAIDIGTAGVLATYLLYPEAMRPFGTDTGWCRADCTYNPDEAGSTCPGATAGMMDAHTCSPGSRVCVEGCISDNECRFSFEQTREGLFVTSLSGTATCSPTTHRCEWTRADANSVGDVCERSSDCAEDVGVCLNGGTCGEYDCAFAADTMSNMACDGGAGVCLGNGGNMASICVQGCNQPSDCNPGNTCIPFGMGMTAAGFTGYCLGICDTRADDPDGVTGPMTAADDVLWVCQSGELCDNPPPTATNLDPTGDCRVPCSDDAECATRHEGNFCDIIPGSTPAVGFCRWQDQVCSYQDLSDDCWGDQVCDLLAFEANLGLCIDGCTTDYVDGTMGAGECPMARPTCVTAGGRNVCRRPCTTGGPMCPTGEICQGGFCEQLTTM